LRVQGLTPADNFSRLVKVPDHAVAVGALMDWIEKRIGHDALTAIGHRVVHGGPKYSEPERITAEMVDDLKSLSPFDPEHLPEEILLTDAFHRRYPDLSQVACFDTAFHQNMPRVARMLPIPRRYEAQGVRRYGFHGLSYAYLMEELTRLGDPAASKGRAVLAHLGSGASLAAVLDGKSIDTSMSFTPAAGVPMGTRTGDIDPGLLWYLARTEKTSAKQFNEMVNFESGLLGMSETSSDMHELLDHEKQDVGRPKRSRCFAIRSRNGSARSPRHWADWTPWFSREASAKTRRRSGRGSVTGWGSLELTLKKNETRLMRP
jgi:acetate kinase